MIFAVVPAAGKSTRMGRPKLSLPVGARTVLECVVDALRSGGVEHIIVVLGPHVADMTSMVEQAGAGTLLLTRETAHMRDTVQEGLDHLAQRFQPKGNDVWLLAPADHPRLSGSVTAGLIQRAAGDLLHSIFVPTYFGRRGHPVLFRWHHAAGIVAFQPDRGLNAYVRAHAAHVLEVRVDDPDILLDMDTVEDYQRLLGH